MALPTGKFIDETTYWKWRYTIECMSSEEAKLNAKHKFAAAMEKDLEIAKLKLLLYKQQIKNQAVKNNEAKDNYKQMKLEIEEKIGMSLNETAINDETLEIIALNEELLENS